ncbi:MAG: hypothetical protein DRQ55_08005 [Planctomycetota bacterium]|nr:MAG: hypothetical protein DRQ55_08005 [Planctomycetota bacterium]
MIDEQPDSSEGMSSGADARRPDDERAIPREPLEPATDAGPGQAASADAAASDETVGDETPADAGTDAGTDADADGGADDQAPVEPLRSTAADDDARLEDGTPLTPRRSAPDGVPSAYVEGASGGPDRAGERRGAEDPAGPLELSSAGATSKLRPGGRRRGDPAAPDAEPELESESFERPGGLLSRIDGHVIIYHQPHSLQAEQYRAFRATLSAMNPGGAPWAIVVTSARKGEGKSTTATNLAACLAELPGQRVCIVDADSRSPSQAQLLGCTPRVGLTEVLEGKAALNEATMVTLLPGLDCVHSGREPANPAEVLGSDAFAHLLGELKRRYSWIVLDSPPVNPFTDPCVLAAQCDGAILVVRLQTAPRELVTSSVDAITNAGGRVLGTFVTGLTPDTDDDAEVSGYERISDEDRALLRKGGKDERELRKQERERSKREKAAVKQQRRQGGADEEFPV